MSKKMIYKGNEPREFPRFGVFKPGDDEIEFNETLFKTGFFEEIKSKKKKDGDE